MSKKKPRPQPVPAPKINHLIDAHTHLASCAPTDEAGVRAVVGRAKAAGVDRICTVGDDLHESELALQAAYYDPDVYAACAIHPTRAAELNAAAKARLTELAADPRCVAIGETGMDTYWIEHEPETTASVEEQEESFRWHIQLAVDSGKALMIHNREADQHIFRILDSAPTPPAVILHCFSSPFAVAREAVERGYVLSFSGNVTFKRNSELREAAAFVPVEQLFIETDAPYMTPEPFRGSKNEPSLIGYTTQCVADVRGVPVEELAVQLTQNFDRIYRTGR